MFHESALYCYAVTTCRIVATRIGARKRRAGRRDTHGRVGYGLGVDARRSRRRDELRGVACGVDGHVRLGRAQTRHMLAPGGIFASGAVRAFEENTGCCGDSFSAAVPMHRHGLFIQGR